MSRQIIRALAHRVRDWRARRGLAVGIAMGEKSVRIAGAREGQIIFVLESDLVDADFARRETLLELLRRAPLTPRELRRARVVVACGPALVQVRRLDGLPPVEDRTLLLPVVRESAKRWFLVPRGDIDVGEVCRLADGAWWGAAFDRDAVQDIRDALRAADTGAAGIVPTVTVLGAVLRGKTIAWRDGDESVRVEMREGSLFSIEQVGLGEISREDAVPCPGLASLGDDALAFADAVGAAVLPRRSMLLALPDHASDGAGRPVPQWRSRLAAAAMVVTVVLATVAYPLAALVARGRADAGLNAVAERETAAVQRSLEYGAALESIKAIASRTDGRGSWVRRLAELTAALPAGTAITAIHSDGVNGTVVVLGPRAGALIERLEGARGLVSPEMVGPVTTELVGGSPLKRATVRFRLSASVAAASVGTPR